MTTEEVLSVSGTAGKVPGRSGTGLWVASVLRERIAAGQLAPGVKLSEQSLCKALGVSRNTLREAFTMLASEHIVTRMPNRGVFVSHPTVEDVREIYRVRRFIEPAALLWSAPGSATPLWPIVESARQARGAGDIPGMVDANQEFHSALVAMAGSTQLNELMARVLAEMRLVFHALADNPAFHEPYVEDNAHIAALLVAGRRQEAAAFMIAYLDGVEARLLRVIGEDAA